MPETNLTSLLDFAEKTCYYSASIEDNEPTNREQELWAQLREQATDLDELTREGGNVPPVFLRNTLYIALQLLAVIGHHRRCFFNNLARQNTRDNGLES